MQPIEKFLQRIPHPLTSSFDKKREIVYRQPFRTDHDAVYSPNYSAHRDALGLSLVDIVLVLNIN